MATINELKKFYTCCMGCKNTSKECPSILRNKEVGLVPRGFYFKSQYFESPRKILVVANNPGEPAESEEEYYENKRGLARARSQNYPPVQQQPTPTYFQRHQAMQHTPIVVHFLFFVHTIFSPLSNYFH